MSQLSSQCCEQVSLLRMFYFREMDILKDIYQIKVKLRFDKYIFEGCMVNFFFSHLYTGHFWRRLTDM